MDSAVQRKIDELVQIILQTVEGTCAIALAGAHAKGAADGASDIDLYIYAEGAKPAEERRSVIAAAADKGTPFWVDESFESNPWGGSMDFQYRGTPVEATARTLDYTRRIVADCLEGRYQIIPATWTSNGYYTFIHLCELGFIKPIHDPDGVLAQLQEQARVYPPKLKKAICQDFLGRASTWLWNFHYDSAISRQDLLFCAPIVQHTVLDMVQVIFALNECYFTGDKKLETALKSMEYCPAALLEQLEFLLTTPRDTGLLARQRTLLREIYGELKESANMLGVVSC